MCHCFICNVFVYLVTLWAHSLHLDALRAMFSPPCSTLEDLVIKNEPKYCTDRPVNDHLHAVIRSCCVSRSTVPVQTALCMSAGGSGFMRCQHK